MTTQLVQTLDAASGWQLTPEQRKALFDIESKIMAFEMGYQIHQKTLSTLERGVKRQAAIATQLFAKTNQVAAQCETLNESVELLTEALKVMGDHLEQDPSDLVQALEDQIKGLQAKIDKINEENSTTDGAIIGLADQMKDLRPWITSLVEALATDLIAGWEKEVEPIAARLDALEQAQTPPKAPPRRTRKTTAK